MKKEQLVMYASNHAGSLYNNLFMATLFLAVKYKLYALPADSKHFMLEGTLLIVSLFMFLRQRDMYKGILKRKLKDADCPRLIWTIAFNKLLYMLPWLFVLFTPLQSVYFYDHMVGFAFIFCVIATYGSASAPVPFLLFFDIALPVAFAGFVTFLDWQVQDWKVQETPYCAAAILFFSVYVLSVGRKMLKSTLELVDSKHQMALSARRADDANRAKSSFLALMSHEIRTPMTGIFGMLDFLKETPLNAEQKDFVHTISDCSKTLLNTLNDVLDFSKVESGKLGISAVNYDFHAMLEHAARLLRQVAEDKGLKLNVFIAKDVPARVRGDSHRIQQIVVNLINNAVKFTEKGEVSLRASWLEGKKPMLRVEVSDTGIGISKENQARLFSAFSQADDSISRKFGGTGLGLSIAKKLVELMGGKIGVTSEEGKGSTFYFELPYEPPMEGGEEEDADHDSARNVPPQDILVVEDNEVSQRIIVKMLTKKGHRVTAVNNGDAAIEAVKKQDFNLVFMDVNMPGRNGLDTTRAIIAMGGKYKKLPIIGLTANIMEDFVRRCREAGMVAHVPKPFSPRSLYDAVAEIATGKAAPQEMEKPQKTMRETLTMVRDGMGIDYMRGMVESNLKEVERLHALVNDEYARENLRALGDVAHDLKSVSGLIGMNDTSAVAAAIEAACLDNKPADLPALLPEVGHKIGKESAEAERLARTIPDL